MKRACVDGFFTEPSFLLPGPVGLIVVVFHTD